MSLTVACVLRSGGEYDETWVHALRRQVDEHLEVEHRFVCLTDTDPSGVEVVPLRHDWPGWWSKAELFRLTGRVLYLDLDTLIVDGIDALAGYDGGFATLRDFWSPEISASGVMVWDGGDPPPIYERMVEDLPPFRGRFDRWWNRHVTPDDHLQDLFPGLIGSYKAQSLEDWKQRSGPELADGPGDYSVVCFHGEPAITDVLDSWVGEAWAT